MCLRIGGKVLGLGFIRLDCLLGKVERDSQNCAAPHEALRTREGHVSKALSQIRQCIPGYGCYCSNGRSLTAVAILSGPSNQTCGSMILSKHLLTAMDGHEALIHPMPVGPVNACLKNPSYQDERLSLRLVSNWRDTYPNFPVPA